MSDAREETKAWVLQVLEATGWTATELARRAGLSASTLTRFLNDPHAGHNLSTGTLKAIERATGIAPFSAPPEGRPLTLRETELVPYEAKAQPPTDPLARAVSELRADGNAIDAWTLQSRCLELVGYLPGDILIVDLNASPKHGDIVVAQVYEWARGRAETVMRIYEPPFLIAASTDEQWRKPLIVDNENVIIKGVVIHSLRPRRAPAAALSGSPQQR